MNVEIGAEAAHFPEKEYINIAIAVQMVKVMLPDWWAALPSEVMSQAFFSRVEKPSEDITPLLFLMNMKGLMQFYKNPIYIWIYGTYIWLFAKCFFLTTVFVEV